MKIDKTFHSFLLYKYLESRNFDKMTEAQVGFLLKAASVLNRNNNTEVTKILESYYLLRCKEITKGFGLPKQMFSEEVRCSHCCIEWNHVEPKLKSVVLSKRQRKRIRSHPKNKESNNKKYLLHCKELVKTCSFCSKSITQILPKPKQSLTNEQQIKDVNKIDLNNETRIVNIEPEKTNKKRSKKKNKVKNNRLQSSVYCESKVAFSMNDKRNVIPSTIKEPPKIIKNNKKKKDKLAGLCHRAVSAAAKFKQEKENKLNLFLKKSS